MISYEGELDINNKLNNFLKITGILNNVFRIQKPFKKTRIKLHNTLALPVLLYSRETWTIKARDSRRITAAEMKYMRRIRAGYTYIYIYIYIYISTCELCDLNHIFTGFYTLAPT